jgi:hypothetical protein
MIDDDELPCDDCNVEAEDCLVRLFAGLDIMTTNIGAKVNGRLLTIYSPPYAGHPSHTK